MLGITISYEVRDIVVSSINAMIKHRAQVSQIATNIYIGEKLKHVVINMLDIKYRTPVENAMGKSITETVQNLYE